MKSCIVSVLLKPAKDLAGVWTAHCLQLDIVTQGEGFDGALNSIREALHLVVDDDLNCGLDPLERPSAPKEYWDEFSEIMRGGVSLDSIDDLGKVTAVVTQLRITRDLHPALDAESIDYETLPAPWVIAQLQGGGLRSQHC